MSGNQKTSDKWKGSAGTSRPGLRRLPCSVEQIDDFRGREGLAESGKDAPDAVVVGVHFHGLEIPFRKAFQTAIRLKRDRLELGLRDLDHEDSERRFLAEDSIGLLAAVAILIYDRIRQLDDESEQDRVIDQILASGNITAGGKGEAL